MQLTIGTQIFNSPVGPGVVTGITDAGYPQVNYIAVGRLVVKHDGNFHVFDPNSSYGRGDYELFIDDERELGADLSSGTVLVRSSQEAIDFVTAVGAIPKKIYFDHDLGGTDTSIVLINKLIDFHLDGKIKFRNDFSFEVHSQNPIGSSNIKSLLECFLKTEVNHDQLD